MNRQIVEHILLQAGLPMRLKGYAYIVDALLLLDTSEWAQPKWTALYYKLGLMHAATAAQVERAIRSAFASARSRFENYEMTEHYLGFTNCDNSNTLIHLYRAVKQECPQPEAIMQIDPVLLRELVRQTLLDMLMEAAPALRKTL